MLAIIIITIFLDCRSFHCDPKPVPMNAFPSYAFQTILGPTFSPAFSASTPLAWVFTRRTEVQCPGLAPIILHLALYYLNLYCKGQLEFPENPCCTVSDLGGAHTLYTGIK